MKANVLDGLKVEYENGYLTFSEEVEGEIGIYFAGKRLRDYTMIRKHPMLALYTVYVGDQARYLNYFRKDGEFRGERIRLSPFYGGYILDDSEEGVVFGRCVRVGDAFIMPLTGMRLEVSADGGIKGLKSGEVLKVSGENGESLRIRRCILDAGVDVTEEVGRGKVEWRPVCAEGGIISFRKDVMGIPEAIRDVTVRRGKIRILSDASFALSELYLVVKRGLIGSKSVRLRVYPVKMETVKAAKAVC